MDDLEFSEGRKSLSTPEFASLALYLRDLLYSQYWIHALPDNVICSEECSTKGLFNMQLMYLASKVFNHLISRNERLNYCSNDHWTWASIPPSEFEVYPHWSKII
jgi:hypothetical protein